LPNEGRKRTRSRDTYFRLGGTNVTTTHGLPGLISADQYAIPPIKGRQVTVSEGHPWNSRNKRILADIGGDFSTTRQYIECSNAPVDLHTYRVLVPGFPSFYEAKWHGVLYPMDPHSVSFPASIHTSDDDLDEEGATAIARCKPTNSVADLATAIGEIYTGGLPHLLGSSRWKERNKVARDAGSEFLNQQFGWLPLVNDVRDLANAVAHANTVLAQYERDSGKVVRRRYNFPIERERSDSVYRSNALCYVVPGNSELSRDMPRGNVNLTVETVRRKWFSGAFTYHLPHGNDYRGGMSRDALLAKKLLGLSLTPDTLWNLTPWSWAVDWFSNTGDVISNMTDWATDGLVLRYGYMMEQSTVKHTYTITDSGLIDRNIHVPPISYVTETKVRRRANPFGFGVSWDGLSPRQLSIAAALGLSRS
jgi:hypothetical protein